MKPYVYKSVSCSYLLVTMTTCVLPCDDSSFLCRTKKNLLDPLLQDGEVNLSM